LICNIHGFSPRLAYCSTSLIYHLHVHRISDGALVHCIDGRFDKAPIDIDPEHARHDFSTGVQAWRETEECMRIKTLLATEPLPASITKIIAFALGDIAQPRSRQARSICQHAMILSVRDALDRRRGPDQPAIRCFAQDPAYNDVDEKVLGEAGITVLGDPRGFLEVDDATVVISISPNIPVRQIVADIARPAVLMWDMCFVCKTDPESSRVQRMVWDHYTEPVPVGEKEMFGGTSMYIRRTDAGLAEAGQTGGVDAAE
ncbi:hypothetical protein C8A05DRAFT_39575, partial [Staphylotrichum tortipilum]